MSMNMDRQQEMRMLPKVIAYHPSFLVSHGGEHKVIEVDMSDWFEDGDVLRRLGELYQAGTVGELVEKIERAAPLMVQPVEKAKEAVGSGILGVRVVDVSPEAVTDAPWWRSPPRMLMSVDRSRLKLGWDESLSDVSSQGVIHDSSDQSVPPSVSGPERQ
jgi:hypothetical protein